MKYAFYCGGHASKFYDSIDEVLEKLQNYIKRKSYKAITATIHSVSDDVIEVEYLVDGRIDNDTDTYSLKLSKPPISFPIHLI